VLQLQVGPQEHHTHQCSSISCVCSSAAPAAPVRVQDTDWYHVVVQLQVGPLALLALLVCRRGISTTVSCGCVSVALVHMVFSLTCNAQHWARHCADLDLRSCALCVCRMHMLRCCARTWRSLTWSCWS
jgi:hypothetical protein